MPSTIAVVDKLFAAGAESVTLTRAEWVAIQEISKGYSANGLEVARAQREMERVKRISRRVRVACKIVAGQMRRAMEGTYGKPGVVVSRSRLEAWEMRLRHSMDVSWSDPPANHPKRMVDWRRCACRIAGRPD